MPWLLCAGKEPPRTDLVSLLLSPLVLGSVLLPTVPLEVALKTMLVLVLTILGTLLTRPFGAKSLEIFVPVLINSLVFFSRFGIVTAYQGAIAIVITLTAVMTMFRNVKESYEGMEKAIENVFVIALGIAKLVATLDPTNTLTKETAEGLVLCIVKIMESPSTRFAYVPAMSVVVTLVPRAPAHVTFVSMVVTALSSLLLILNQREILERPGKFTGIIFVIVSVALIFVKSFSLPPVLMTIFGLSVLFAANFEFMDLFKILQPATQLFLTLWKIYCDENRPDRCTDCFNLFFPEFLALVTMAIERCSIFEIWTIISLTILSKRLYTWMLWNYFSSMWITLLIHFIQFLFLLLVSNIRAICVGLFTLLLRQNIVNETNFKVVTFLPPLITLFVLETTSLPVMVLVVAGLRILSRFLVFITSGMSMSPLEAYHALVLVSAFVICILISGIVSEFMGIISGFAYVLCCDSVLLKLSLESKAWALLLTSGLGVSVWLAPTKKIGMDELLTLVSLILIIAETNTAPWPKQCFSE